MEKINSLNVQIEKIDVQVLEVLEKITKLELR